MFHVIGGGMGIGMISHQVTRLAIALQEFDADAPRLQAWGSVAGKALLAGHRLLVCADSASLPEALHLAAELGTGSGPDRPPLPVLVVPRGEVADEGFAYADGVRELGSEGDILICLSVARPLPGLVEAARVAGERGMTAWALTGPEPRGLANACADWISVSAPEASVVEEVHLVAMHIMCAAASSCVRDGVRLPDSAA